MRQVGTWELGGQAAGNTVAALRASRKSSSTTPAGTCGYDGFWGDNFQNLFMSTLDWANGTGTPLQRTWWKQLAAWSREGIGWMAESHSAPGLSCSIEVDNWEEDFWYFPHVVRPPRWTSQSDSD
ncbi:MAG: hypothetical protein ACLFUJ_00735 [Phycisphaerae bacterium]